MAGSTDDGDTDKSPWTQPGFMVAAAVVGFVVVLGLILVVTGGPKGDTRNPGATSSPSASVPPSRASQGPDASACGLAGGDHTVPSAAPTAKWELRGNLAAPSAPAVGPGAVKNGLVSCFAHSPTGALFAAINFVAMTSIPSQREAVARDLSAHGVGRDVALAKLRKEGAGAPSNKGVQIAGFSIVNYDKTASVVDLAFRVDQPGRTGFVHTAMSMRWEDRDWKVVIARDGEPFDSLEQIPDLSGYIAWSGV